MSGPKSFVIVDASTLIDRALAQARQDLESLARELLSLQGQAESMLRKVDTSQLLAADRGSNADIDKLRSLITDVRQAYESLEKIISPERRQRNSTSRALLHDSVRRMEATMRFIASAKASLEIHLGHVQLIQLREEVHALRAELRILDGTDDGPDARTTTVRGDGSITDLTFAEGSIAELEAAKTTLIERVMQRRSAMRRELIDEVMRDSEQQASKQSTVTSAAASEPPLEVGTVDPTLQRVLARLDVDVPEATRGELLARAASIRPDSTRYRAMTNDLRHRVTVANQSQKEWRAESDRLNTLRYELQAASDPGADQHLATIDAALLARRALSQPEATAVEAYLRAARAHVDRSMVQARVEEALTDLGYTLGPPFQTLFVEGGNALVQLPDHHGYFVRWSVDEHGQRVNTFLVRDASAAGRQPGHDTAAEASWCDDFARLQQSLHDHGFEARLVRQTAIGTHPVPAMAVPTTSKARTPVRGRTRNKRSRSAS